MLRLLAAVGWADGEFAGDEAEAIERLIAAAELDPSERETARTWLTAPVELGEIDIEGLSENQRLATYQAAVRIALIDGHVPDAEREFLDRVRDVLGLDPERALEIEAEMPRHD
ncbi:Tellurite resistance protein TerB [Enhygromyxa salina]|uniref:Tellurite resistance protein TerB n=2 Tax=Enhygromyxa salina TaxID=215803 RepID=A0A2S9YS83_9BACT|nr:Tellurite resistance protein TerB [Enhygromyxa salina]